MKHDLIELKEKLERKEREFESLKGRQAQILEQLKEEHGVSGIEEAEKKLSVLHRKIVKLEEDLEERLEDFQEEYKDLLQ